MVTKKNKFCIKRLYRSRTQYRHHDDSAFQDQWQLEVYLHALGLMKKHHLNSIVDIGCGSAYKLITYLGEYKTTGIELSENVQMLQKKYPDRTWLVSDFSSRSHSTTDVIICSDVIEHLINPDELVEYIKGISFKYLVIATPDRSLIYRPWKQGFWGPPRNKAHQREWTFREFKKYLSLHFDVVDHRITSLFQGTQMAICIPKKD